MVAADPLGTHEWNVVRTRPTSTTTLLAASKAPETGDLARWHFAAQIALAAALLGVGI